MSGRQSPTASPAPRNISASPAVRNIQSSPVRQENHRNITINVDSLINFLRNFEDDRGEWLDATATARLPIYQQRQSIGTDIEEKGEEEDVIDSTGLIEIRSEKITPFLNRIEARKYTYEDLHVISDYANSHKYSNAEFFKQQIIFSFYKLVQLQAKFNPRTLSFEEVKAYLQTLLSKINQSERAEVFAECRFVRN